MARITAIKRLINAFGFSIQGLKTAFKGEPAFRQEVYVTVFLLPLGLYLGATSTEKALLVATVLLVLVVELINSAIEAAVDRFGTEHHLLSGRAKDLGSAAVLMAIINAVVVWACILMPY